jgi:hypothetical protein
MRVLFALCLLCLCACTNTTEVGQQFSVDAANQIRTGVSDKAAVQALLGSGLTI